MNGEFTVENIVPLTERQSGSFLIREERSYCVERERIEKKIAITDTRTQSQREYHESVKVYSEFEIRGLLESVGLEVDQILGDFAGAPFSPASPRMIVTGHRRQR